jgi:transcriptional regulator with XRE-family HTH domain
MNPGMEPAHPLEPDGEGSPLARARLHRHLTLAETARRAGISEEQAQWLEEGRVYRFPTPDDALVAALLYGTALGVDNREARELAGLPVPAAVPTRSRTPRLAVLAAVATGIALLAALLLVPRGGAHRTVADAGAVLPPPWRVDVNVLNGSGDINYTRTVASHVQAFGYQITDVGRADSFNYPQTAVYFPPGCDALATRLGRELGVATKPLPGGTGPCKLWVIVGPARGPGE